MANPTELQAQALKLLEELMNLTQELPGMVREAKEKTSQYRELKAKLFLASDGTMDIRKAMVDKSATRERTEAHIGEALVNARMERIKALQTGITLHQSLLRVALAEDQLSRQGY